MAASVLFYDLETFGTDPRRSRIAQVAATRNVDRSTENAPRVVDDDVVLLRVDRVACQQRLEQPHTRVAVVHRRREPLRNGVAQLLGFEQS